MDNRRNNLLGRKRNTLHLTAQNVTIQDTADDSYLTSDCNVTTATGVTYAIGALGNTTIGNLSDTRYQNLTLDCAGYYLNTTTNTDTNQGNGYYVVDFSNITLKSTNNDAAINTTCNATNGDSEVWSMDVHANIQMNNQSLSQYQNLTLQCLGFSDNTTINTNIYDESEYYLTPLPIIINSYNITAGNNATTGS